MALGLKYLSLLLMEDGMWSVWVRLHLWTWTWTWTWIGSILFLLLSTWSFINLFTLSICYIVQLRRWFNGGSVRLSLTASEFDYKQNLVCDIWIIPLSMTLIQKKLLHCETCIFHTNMCFSNTIIHWLENKLATNKGRI